MKKQVYIFNFQESKMIIHEITIKQLKKDLEKIMDRYDASTEVSQDVYYIFDDKMTECKGMLMDYKAYPDKLDPNKSFITKIDKEGNLIIPKTICNDMGWEEGTELDITEEKGVIVIKKVLDRFI